MAPFAEAGHVDIHTEGYKIGSVSNAKEWAEGKKTDSYEESTNETNRPKNNKEKAEELNSLKEGYADVVKNWKEITHENVFVPANTPEIIAYAGAFLGQPQIETRANMPDNVYFALSTDSLKELTIGPELNNLRSMRDNRYITELVDDLSGRELRLADLDAGWEMLCGPTQHHAKLQPAVNLALLKRLQERGIDEKQLQIWHERKAELPELMERGRKLAARIVEKERELPNVYERAVLHMQNLTGEKAAPRSPEQEEAMMKYREARQEWVQVAGSKRMIPSTEEQVLAALDRLESHGPQFFKEDSPEAEALMIRTKDDKRLRWPNKDEIEAQRQEAHRGLLLEAAYDLYFDRGNVYETSPKGLQMRNPLTVNEYTQEALNEISQGNIKSDEVIQYRKEIEIRRKAAKALQTIYTPAS